MEEGRRKERERRIGTPSSPKQMLAGIDGNDDTSNGFRREKIDDRRRDILGRGAPIQQHLPRRLMPSLRRQNGARRDGIDA